MTSATASARRSFPLVPRRLLRDHLEFALLVWAGFVVFVLAVILTVAYFRDIEVSGWDRAIEVVRWFGLGIGAYVGYSVLPLHVTHGQTRREFAQQAVVFGLIFTLVLAALVTVGFVLEMVLYQLADWPQEVAEGQLFSSANELHLIFLQSWLLMALWFAGGMLIGAGWYRGAWFGSLAIIVAMLAAAVSGLSLSNNVGLFGAPLEWLTGSEVLSAPLGVAVHVVTVIVVLAIGWLFVRDIPIQNKSA